MILPRDFVAHVATLAPRIIYTSNCRSYNSRTGRCNSAWNRWGRWVLAGILIFFAIALVLFLACLRNRRRRRAYTTAAPMQPVSGYNNQGYANQNPNGYGPGQQYAPPQGPPPGGYNVANGGYYGQQSGVAQPGNAFQPAYK